MLKFHLFTHLYHSLFNIFVIKVHHIGDQTVYFYFFERPEHYNQEVLSHSFICLPLPHLERIVLIVTLIFIV